MCAYTFDSVSDYYDRLTESGDDPFHDPPALREYMDLYDGEAFIDGMTLEADSVVLEIGVGTGRLAKRVAIGCKVLCGIDISPVTLKKAGENLCGFDNIELVCGDFLDFRFDKQFDIVYSSLTFMHIKEKKRAFDKVFSLLKNGGRFVLSIDKSNCRFVDTGFAKIEVFPDNKEDTARFLRKAGFETVATFETSQAHIFVCRKA